MERMKERRKKERKKEKDENMDGCIFTIQFAPLG